MDEVVRDRIKNTIEGNRVVLFMKGSRNFPQCGFSAQIVHILKECGADFRDMYRFFLNEGCEPRDSYQQALRVFRGSLPAGTGPITKDLAYGRGLLAVARLLRRSPGNGQAGLIASLFCGKTRLEDLTLLNLLFEEGLVARPHFVPPPFVDRTALANL